MKHMYAFLLLCGLCSTQLILCNNDTEERMQEFESVPIMSYRLGGLDPFTPLLYAFQPTAITDVTVISDSGAYAVTRDIAVTSGIGIEISASNVYLDLRGHTITGSGSATDGIVVDSGKSNVTIINGTINNFTTGSGIRVNGTLCEITDCSFSTNLYGIYFSSSAYNLIKNCIALGCSGAGYYLSSTTQTGFLGCQVFGTVSTTNAYGFYATGGSNFEFRDCKAVGIITLSTSKDNEAAAFKFNSASRGTVVNSIADGVGVGNPLSFASTYGIVLDALTGVMTRKSNFIHTEDVYASRWSVASRLAIGSDTTTEEDITVYTYYAGVLRQVASTDHGAAVYGVSWSPSGQYLVIGGQASGGVQLRAYSYDSDTFTQIDTSSAPGATVNDVAWYPITETTLAAVNSSAGPEIQLFSLNQATPASGALSVLTTATHGAVVNACSWAPKGTYFAIGGVSGGSPVADTRVYSFNGSTLTLLNSVSHGATVTDVDWSAKGRYLAVAGGNTVEVFEFDSTGPSLTSVATASHGDIVNSCRWSADGKYLAIGGVRSGGSGNKTHRIYSFTNDGVSYALTLLDSQDQGGTVNTVSWPTSERLLAVGGVQVSSVPLSIYSIGITGCSDCVIQHNQVSRVVGGRTVGVGMSVSSTAHIALSNSSINNDCSYILMANIYTGGLFGSPSIIQNVAIPPR